MSTITLMSDLDIAGPDDARTIVLLHGMGLTRKMWQPQLQGLSDEYRVIALDLPGHGALGDEPFGLDAAVERVAQVIDEEAGGRALLVGLSLGGYVAMALAGRYPEKLVGLVLASCSAIPRGAMSFPYRAAAWISRKGGARGLDLLNAGLTRVLYRGEIARAILEGGFYSKAVPEVVAEVTGRDFLAAIRRYPGPALFLNGRLDAAFRKDEDVFVSAAQNARLQIIPRAGHLSNVHRPEAFTEAVRGFAGTLSW